MQWRRKNEASRRIGARKRDAADTLSRLGEANLPINETRYLPYRLPISVSAAREGLLVVILVFDKGKGIPAVRLPHLFKKVFRIEAGDQGGDTGLGLAICKGIVEAHGSRIWAESDGPGQGTPVSFTDPAVEQAEMDSLARPNLQPALRHGR